MSIILTSAPLIPLTEVAARQNPPCHPTTVQRRARKDPTFPPILKVAGRNYVEAALYEAHERQREAAA